MPAYALMLSRYYYAQNYADIIHKGLSRDPTHQIVLTDLPSYPSHAAAPKCLVALPDTHAWWLEWPECCAEISGACWNTTEPVHHVPS